MLSQQLKYQERFRLLSLQIQKFCYSAEVPQDHRNKNIVGHQG